MQPADLRNCDDFPFVGASTSRGNGEFLPNDQSRVSELMLRCIRVMNEQFDYRIVQFLGS
jgi:hypothetical protein